MPAHRHWRLRFSESINNQYVWLEEVSFRGAGDTDLSVGGTASASSFQNASFTADMAFDKIDTTGGWSTASSQALGSWIAYDHVTPVEPLGVNLQVPNTGAPLDDLPYVDRTRFEWSDDGVNWFPHGYRCVQASGSFTSLGDVARWEPDLTPLVVRSLRRGRYFSAPNGYGQLITARNPLRLATRYDPIDAGAFKIVGYTRKKALPTNIDVYRRVFLLEMNSLRVLRETWSDPVTGYYEFLRIKQGRYMVIGYDHTLEQNGVIATDIPLEPM